MQRYVDLLLSDIDNAICHVSDPMIEIDIDAWKSGEENDMTMPLRNLQEWTGITAEMLPPESMLEDEQLAQLLHALNQMLDAYHYGLFDKDIPNRIQYTAIKENFNQDVELKNWPFTHFRLCRPGTEHAKCVLGEYCPCAYDQRLLSGDNDEYLTPDEERIIELEITVEAIKRKYGDDWLKYYPYHLDPIFDDDDGNPWDYGMGNEEDSDEPREK
jgi:hypothetical protein